MKSSKQIDKLLAEESARWTEVLLCGEEHSMAAFAEWSRKSPQHMKHFLLMTALDQELMNIDPERRIEVPPVSASDAAAVTSLPSPTEEIVVVSSRSPWWRWNIAAALAAGVVLASLIATYGPFADWQTFETMQGEQRAMQLPDGSIMHLNTKSSAKVLINDNERRIHLLEGEALFKVAKDPTRAFRVYTSDAVIQAIGTQFNVYAQHNGTKVSVLEGRVKVSPGTTLVLGGDKQSTSLRAGQEAKVNDSGEVKTSEAADVTTLAAWRQRRLMFNQQPLSTVVTEFNRYNRVPQLRVMDAELGARQYSGAFDADDPASLVELLSIDPRLELVNNDDEILIRQRHASGSTQRR